MLSFKEFLTEKKKQRNKPYNPIKSMDFSSDNITDDDDMDSVDDPLDRRTVGESLVISQG